MRQFVLAPALAAGLLFAAASALPASADPAAAPPPAQNDDAADDGQAPAVAPTDQSNRIVCRRERPVGSNRPVKTCKTAAEWKAEREDAARAVRGGRGGVRPGGGLGATPGPGL